jgi:hypothetical protein
VRRRLLLFSLALISSAATGARDPLPVAVGAMPGDEQVGVRPLRAHQAELPARGCAVQVGDQGTGLLPGVSGICLRVRAGDVEACTADTTTTATGEEESRYLPRVLAQGTSLPKMCCPIIVSLWSATALHSPASWRGEIMDFPTGSSRNDLRSEAFVQMEIRHARSAVSARVLGAGFICRSRTEERLQCFRVGAYARDGRKRLPASCHTAPLLGKH